MADLGDTVDSVLEEVDTDEITEFNDYVADRMTREDPAYSRPTVEKALGDIFVLDRRELNNPKLQEKVEEQMQITLEDYRDGELFTVELPAFDEPFDRHFFRHNNPEGSTTGFKEFYKSRDENWCALVPKEQYAPTMRRKAEQVMTMVHGAEVIEANGYSVPASYVPTAVIRDGMRMPGVYSRLNTDMKTLNEMTEEEKEIAEPEIAEASQAMANLVIDGDIASSKINDYFGPGTELNQAYDFDNYEPIIPDTGELYEPFFEKDVVEHDSVQEFLEYHNLDSRTDNYMEAFGFK